MYGFSFNNSFFKSREEVIWVVFVGLYGSALGLGFILGRGEMEFL